MFASAREVKHRMLKIIIVDDERFTRETLAHIINWEEYHIKVIGLCKNGLEAYDMILDDKVYSTHKIWIIIR